MKQFKEVKEFYIIGGVKHGVLTMRVFNMTVQHKIKTRIS